MKLILTTITIIALTFSVFADDKKPGPFVDYYESGNIKTEGFYGENNQREGNWKDYYEDGKLKCSRNFKRDNMVGEYKEYFPSGELRVEGNYSPYLTRKEGVWKEYFDNGKLKKQAQYHKNQLCGIYLEYYKNGNLSLKGEYDYFRYTKKGDWIEYYDDGSIKSKEFYNAKGVRESKCVIYYPNGNIKETGEYEYMTGQKDGKWISFYESGDTLSVSYFRQGKQVGAHYEFHLNGTNKVVCEYNFTGILHGPYHETDEKGETLSKGTYEEGKQTGKWIIRNELGELKKVKF